MRIAKVVVLTSATATLWCTAGALLVANIDGHYPSSLPVIVALVALGLSFVTRDAVRARAVLAPITRPDWRTEPTGEHNMPQRRHVRHVVHSQPTPIPLMSVTDDTVQLAPRRVDVVALYEAERIRELGRRAGRLRPVPKHR
jgi:hypothetical protein